MADSNFVLARGFDAAAAITKNRAVKAGTDAESCTPVTAKTDVILGVAMFGVSTAEIANGKGASVGMMGIVEMEASAASAVGKLAGLNADGTVHEAASGDRVIGEIVGNAASNAGDIVSVLLNLPGFLAP